MFHKTLGITLLCALPFSAQSATFAVERITITSGSVIFYDPNYGIAGCGANWAWRCLTPGSAATIDDGIAGDGAMDADGLWGDPGNPVVSGVFFDKPMLGFFAHTGSPWYPDDPDPDAVTAMIDTGSGSITGDFSGFFFDWGGTHFLSGGIATGTVSPIEINADGAGRYDFLLTWSVPMYDTVNPPFHVNLAGTLVTAVPEPHAYAFMLAGLSLIGAAAWRRRALHRGCVSRTPRE